MGNTNKLDTAPADSSTSTVDMLAMDIAILHPKASRKATSMPLYQIPIQVSAMAVDN